MFSLFAFPGPCFAGFFGFALDAFFICFYKVGVFVSPIPVFPVDAALPGFFGVYSSFPDLLWFGLPDVLPPAPSCSGGEQGGSFALLPVFDVAFPEYLCYLFIGVGVVF